MKRCIICLFLTLPLFISAQKKYKAKYTVADLDRVPEAPVYSQMDYWIAHPEQEDMADLVPGKGELMEYQSTADVDVFFVYPTIYSGNQEKMHPWFADVNNEKLNKKIAESTIKYQASVFNASGKVYSPLYRQAHINIYNADDLELKVEALAFAYEDVKKAFKYYLENWNNGRPIIIASHSQGSTHAVQLLRDFFQDKPLIDKLVAAYLVGMPIGEGTFNTVPICTDANATSCWLTWNTYIKDYYPPNHEYWYFDVINVNPLSWTTTNEYVSYGENKGGVLRSFKKIRPGLSDAQNQDGMLWINRPKFFGNFLINWDRYHVVDYNLFYLNIRENVEDRVESYLNKNGLKWNVD
ncbi:MAG: DUF3089 domain-containing protein [Ekhidna sp.]